VIKRRISQS